MKFGVAVAVAVAEVLAVIACLQVIQRTHARVVVGVVGGMHREKESIVSDLAVIGLMDLLLHWMVDLWVVLDHQRSPTRAGSQRA
jgi:hypothetical protein